MKHKAIINPNEGKEDKFELLDENNIVAANENDENDKGYAIEDLYKSCLSYFDDRGGDRTYKTLPGKVTLQIDLESCEKATRQGIGVLMEIPDEKGIKPATKIANDFKRIYGVDLTPANAKYAYYNTVTIGKGYDDFAEKGEEKVVRPLFKMNEEVTEENMHMVALCLCRTVQKKTMLGAGNLSGSKNVDIYKDDKMKITSFDNNDAPVVFRDPRENDLVSLEYNPGIPPRKKPETEVKQPKKPGVFAYIGRFFCDTLHMPFGKGGSDAVKQYEQQQEKYIQYSKDLKQYEEECHAWENSDSCISEQQFDEDRIKKANEYFDKVENYTKYDKNDFNYERRKNKEEPRKEEPGKEEPKKSLAEEELDKLAREYAEKGAKMDDQQLLAMTAKMIAMKELMNDGIYEVPQESMNKRADELKGSYAVRQVASLLRKDEKNHSLLKGKIKSSEYPGLGISENIYETYNAYVSYLKGNHIDPQTGLGKNVQIKENPRKDPDQNVQIKEDAQKSAKNTQKSAKNTQKRPRRK